MPLALPIVPQDTTVRSLALLPRRVFLSPRPAPSGQWSRSFHGLGAQVQLRINFVEVRQELPKAFPKAKQLHKTSPLVILDKDAKVADSSGFKAC